MANATGECSHHHLFVCLFSASYKNCKSDLRENLILDVSVDKEEVIKFWKSSAARSWIFENRKTSAEQPSHLFV